MNGVSTTETVLRNALQGPHSYGAIMVDDKPVLYRIQHDKIVTLLEYAPYIQAAVSPEFFYKHITIVTTPCL
jgi:hypothetical protein